MATTPASSTDPNYATTTAKSAASGTHGQLARSPAPGRARRHRRLVSPRPARQPRPSLAQIIEEQEEIFIRRQPESARLAGVAASVLAGGVVSSWQISRPQPVWLSHG